MVWAETAVAVEKARAARPNIKDDLPVMDTPPPKPSDGAAGDRWSVPELDRIEF
jgi:hypothetical protein